MKQLLSGNQTPVTLSYTTIYFRKERSYVTEKKLEEAEQKLQLSGKKAIDHNCIKISPKQIRREITNAPGIYQNWPRI